MAEQQRPRQTQSIVGSLHVSGKLPTYPSPRPTLTLTSHLGHNVALGVGYVGSQRTPREGSYKKLQSFFKDFSRTTLDFQGPPARNIISQIVEKCTFPVYFNKTLRVEENSRTFQGLAQKFKDFSRKNGIQGLFKTVRVLLELVLAFFTHFSRLSVGWTSH